MSHLWDCPKFCVTDGKHPDQWPHHYDVGLELEMPLGNAEAKSASEVAEIEAGRVSRDFDQTMSAVSLDVERAIANVA